MKQERPYRLHLIVLLMCLVLLSCSQTREEQAAASLVHQELKNNNSQVLPDQEQAFRWQQKHPAYQALSQEERDLLQDVNTGFKEIKALLAKISRIENKFKNRYAHELAAKIKLTDLDEKELEELSSSTIALAAKLKKGAVGPDEYYWGKVSEKVSAPHWFRKEDTPQTWFDIYLRDMPVYAALLHLQLFNTALNNLQLALWNDAYQRMGDDPIPEDRLSVNFRHFKDTLDAGATGKGIFYLSGQTGYLPFLGSGYPKSFFLNGKELPISLDLELGEPVVHLAIPTSKTALNSHKAVKQEWSGKWVIGLTEFQDTIIYTGGSYFLIR